jgi:hypothetical protein
VADIDGLGAATLSIDGGAPMAMAQKPGAKSAGFTYSAKLAAGAHTYAIAAVDSAGAAATPCTGVFTVKATVPTITNVKATAKTSADAVVITWTVFDVDGVGGTTLKIDSLAVASGITQVANPNQSVTYTYKDSQPAGKHIFTIDAIDAAVLPASAKQAKGAFTVKATAPTISDIAVTSATAANPTMIKWSAYDLDGIGSVKLTIDGKATTYTQLDSNYTYLGVLAAGKHTYVITVADSQKASKQVTGKFTVATAAAVPAAGVFRVSAMAKVNGTAKTEWLIDYDTISQSTCDADNRDTLFAAY